MHARIYIRVTFRIVINIGHYGIARAFLTDTEKNARALPRLGVEALCGAHV